MYSRYTIKGTITSHMYSRYTIKGTITSHMYSRYTIKGTLRMTLEMQILDWDRRKHVAGINRLMDPNPPFFITASPTAMHI
jgi:hypothetical protein